MAAGYTDTPYNMDEISPYVITDKETIAAEVLERQKCFFYDTCSFRKHANLNPEDAEYLLRYMAKMKGNIIITRCILMELASHSGMLNREYVEYIRHINKFGISVLVIYEEDLFSVMEMCFGTNAAINAYLCWAVRTLKCPVSTITETINQNRNIHDEVIAGRNLSDRGIYQRFFKTVRGNKESGDNLGEELLAICLHILSHMPGEADGKFCVITDDKGAASKMDALFKKTAEQYRGNKIVIFSTPKLVQILQRENMFEDKEHIKAILSTGIDGNIVVLGTLIFDIRSREISLSSEELTELIAQPNGINIIF